MSILKNIMLKPGLYAVYRLKRMLKRKLQDLTVCCTYQINFLHQKAHSTKEFRRQYRVLEEIGRGGFGVVYRAERVSDGYPVAVKFVQHKHVREWTMTGNQLIPSELCHLEACKDVNGVIKLVDWFASSKGFLIIMERPEHCMDLFDLISTYGKLDEDTARGIFLQVVDTVCEMYGKHGLVHRDIKDENLIVNMKTGEVKLVDFGAAAPVDKAMKKEFQGTRSYCPPEWFRQLQYLPMEATSWSLGVLLYIMLTGSLPFKNEIQICLGRITFPSYLSKEVIQLMRRCLCTYPGHRANLAEIRQHTWLNKAMPMHSETFEQVLDQTLGKGPTHTERSPRKTAAECRQASEEERVLNDVILMERQRSSKQNLQKLDKTDSTWMSTECNSLRSMHTCMDSAGSINTLPRLNSRYDNISASSLADYMSLASLDTRADTLSMATTNNAYFSASEINADDEPTDDDCSQLIDLPCGMPVVKSVSAYSFTKARKRSLMARSFDRELGTVPEADPSTSYLSPDVMTSSRISSASTVDEPTLIMETEEDEDRMSVTPTPQEAPPTTSTEPATVESQAIGIDTPPLTEPRPLSRVRPLMMYRPAATQLQAFSPTRVTAS